MKKKTILNKIKRMDKLDLTINIIVFIAALINLFPFYYLLTSSVTVSYTHLTLPTT